MGGLRIDEAFEVFWRPQGADKWAWMVGLMWVAMEAGLGVGLDEGASAMARRGG